MWLVKAQPTEPTNPNLKQRFGFFSTVFLFSYFVHLCAETIEVIWPDLKQDLLFKPDGEAQQVDWSDTLPELCVTRQNHFPAEKVVDIPI